MNRALFSQKTDLWSTPQDLFDKYDAIYHFEIDVCANYSPYQTLFWNKNSRHEKATEAFRPYVEKAVEAWNRRCSDA